MNRKVRFTLVFGILLIWTGLIVTAEGAQEREAQTGIVEFIEGTATIDGDDASIGDTVARGAVIETGASSFCEVVFGEKNVFRIMENTIVEIDLGSRRDNIDILSGGIAAVFQKLSVLGKRDEFSVRTPSVVAGVRGTVFYIQVESSDSTYVCACNGTLGVADEIREEPEVISSNHHMAVRFVTRDGETVTESPGLLYHDDELMDGVAERIQEQIKWGYSY